MKLLITHVICAYGVNLPSLFPPIFDFSFSPQGFSVSNITCRKALTYNYSIQIAPHESQQAWMSAFGGYYYDDLMVNLPRDAEELAEFKRTLLLGGGDPSTVGSLVASSDALGPVSVSLKSLSPPFVAQYTGVLPKSRSSSEIKCESSNCWNASLHWYGLVDVIAYDNVPKMIAALNAHFVAINPSEVRFGDLMILSSEHGDMIHSATFITPEFIWHKISAHDEAGYEFREISDMYKAFSHRRPVASVNYFRKLR